MAMTESRKVRPVILIRISPAATPNEVKTSVLRCQASLSRAMESVALAHFHQFLRHEEVQTG